MQIKAAAGDEVLVETPNGRLEAGRFWAYDEETDEITVEMDYRYLVRYPANKVHPKGGVHR